MTWTVILIWAYLVIAFSIFFIFWVANLMFSHGSHSGKKMFLSALFFPLISIRLLILIIKKKVMRK